MFCFSSKLVLPPVQDFKFCKFLPVVVCGRQLQDKKTVREAVLLAYVPGVDKQRLADILSARVNEDMVTLLAKDIVRTKSGN